MHYHVYRQDHTGRGIQHNDEPLPTYKAAEFYRIEAKAAEPGRVYYIVSEDETGKGLAYPPCPKAELCYVCGLEPHHDGAPDYHNYWSNADAKAAFDAEHARMGAPRYSNGETSPEGNYVQQTRGR